MNTYLKKQKNDFEKDFFKLMNSAGLERLWKMWGNIGVLNFSQQKEKELHGMRTKLSYYKVFYKKVIINRNEKNSDSYK